MVQSFCKPFKYQYYLCYDENLILFTIDANFVDEVKIGRQFPGLMASNLLLLIFICSHKWVVFGSMFQPQFYMLV